MKDCYDLQLHISPLTLSRQSGKECTNPDIVKELFVEYSHIKGAESCFVSFDKELNDLLGFYSGGAIIVGYEEDKPIRQLLNP